MKAAKKTATHYKKKCMEIFAVGDRVLLKLPTINCTCSDLPRLPCIVVDVKGGIQGMYRLRYVLFRHIHTCKG